MPCKPLASRVTTPVFFAAQNGHCDVLEILHKHGANFSVSDSNGAWPLHYAAMGGHHEAMDLLVKYGADIKKVDSKEKTALYVAIEHVDLINFKTVIALLKYGADPYKRYDTLPLALI